MAENETSVSGDVVWQDGDDLSEANLSRHAAKSNLTDYVERGLGLAVDGAAGTIDIGSGHAIIQDGINAYDVFPNQQTDISLPGSGVNHVYVAHQPGTDDDVYYHIDEDDTPPADPSLKIGTADAGAGTSTAVNRDPEGEFDSVSTGAIDITAPIVIGWVDGRADTWVYNKISDFANLGAAVDDLISKATGSLSKNNPSAAGVEIRLPAGDFVGDLTVSDGGQEAITIRGRGSDQTIIDGSWAIETNHVHLHDLHLLDDLTIGTTATATSSAKLENVSVTETTNNGIEIINANSAYLRDCLITQADDGIVAENVNGFSMEQTDVRECRGSAVVLKRGPTSPSDRSMKGVYIGGNCLFRNNDVHGIQAGGVEGLWIHDVRLETNNQADAGGREIEIASDGNGNACQNVVIGSSHFDGGADDRIGGVNAIRVAGASNTWIYPNQINRFNGDSGLTGRVGVNIRPGVDPTYLYPQVYEDNNNNFSTGDRTRLMPSGATLASLGSLSLPTMSDWTAGDVIYNNDDGAVYVVREPGENTNEAIQLEPARARNLSGSTGPRDGWEARDDGSNTTGSGVVCMWDNSNNQWIPQSNDAAFT